MIAQGKQQKPSQSKYNGKPEQRNPRKDSDQNILGKSEESLLPSKSSSATGGISSPQSGKESNVINPNKFSVLMEVDTDPMPEMSELA